MAQGPAPGTPAPKPDSADALVGTFHQAVAKQKFDVVFVRKPR